MLYQAEFGKSEVTYIDQARRNRQPVPAPILDAPELKLGLQVYLQAFFDLEADRKESFSGIGRIPGAAIRAYARDMEFDEEQTDTLNRLIRLMDLAYIKHMEPKSGESPRPSGNGSTAKRANKRIR